MLAAFLPTLNISYSVGLQQLFSDETNIFQSQITIQLFHF